MTRQERYLMSLRKAGRLTKKEQMSEDRIKVAAMKDLGLTLQQISAETGLSMSTVKRRLKESIQDLSLVSGNSEVVNNYKSETQPEIIEDKTVKNNIKPTPNYTGVNKAKAESRKTFKDLVNTWIDNKPKNSNSRKKKANSKRVPNKINPIPPHKTIEFDESHPLYVLLKGASLTDSLGYNSCSSISHALLDGYLMVTW